MAFLRQKLFCLSEMQKKRTQRGLWFHAALKGLVSGVNVSLLCISVIHALRLLNKSGRCTNKAARFRLYLSRHCVLCFSNRSAAFATDSSVGCHLPSTRIAPVGGLPLGAFSCAMVLIDE